MMNQNAFSREELLKCGNGELFGSGNAQLPVPNMLMMDRKHNRPSKLIAQRDQWL